MDVVIYDPNVNAFTAGNIASWSRRNGCDLVIEAHLNAVRDTSAHGCESLKDFHQPLTKALSDIHRAMASHGWRDRGIKPCNGGGGRNLQNPRLMRVAGIPYLLLEFAFITNANDMSIYDRNISNIPRAIMDACKANGVRRLGVVFGHGGRDPGAIGVNGRREANEVRRLNFTDTRREPLPTSAIGEITVRASKLNVRSQANTNSIVLGAIYASHRREVFKRVGDWYQIIYNNQVAYIHAAYVDYTEAKGDELDMDRNELKKILDERDRQLENKVLRKVSALIRPGAVKDHWVEEDFKELNEYLESKGVPRITSETHNDFCTRGEVIRMNNLVRKAIDK